MFAASADLPCQLPDRANNSSSATTYVARPSANLATAGDYSWQVGYSRPIGGWLMKVEIGIAQESSGRQRSGKVLSVFRIQYDSSPFWCYPRTSVGDAPGPRKG